MPWRTRISGPPALASNPLSTNLGKAGRLCRSGLGVSSIVKSYRVPYHFGRMAGPKWADAGGTCGGFAATPIKGRGRWDGSSNRNQLSSQVTNDLCSH